MRHRLIRPANKHDAKRLHEIAHEAYLIYVSRIGKAPAPMLADFAALIDSGTVWAIDEKPIPGYIVMEAIGDTLHVENVAVDPMHHGQGYGRQLLDFAEATARAQGLPRIELFTNVHMTENRSLYPALGYREFARRTEDGFERVYFSKPIPAAP